MYISASSIHVYDSAYALIDDNTTAPEWETVLHSLPNVDGNYSHALGIFENLEDDYETYNYILLDYEHVVMVFNGDIVREWETVSDFIKDTLEEIKTVIEGEDDEQI